MPTLHELALKFQDYIISEQRGQKNFKPQKYNNLKLEISSTFDFPNLTIYIGISKAIYNILALRRISGSLGSDEKYILKWLKNETNADAIRVLYNMTMTMKIAQWDPNQGEASEVDGLMTVKAEAGEVNNGNKVDTPAKKDYYQKKVDPFKNLLTRKKKEDS